MIDKYEEIFARYKKFIESNSQYGARVVKYNTNTSAYFPIVICRLANSIDTDYCTNYKIEYYEGQYYTIYVLTKDKTMTIEGNSTVVASEKINNEITKLTIQFFDKLNMKRTQCRPLPNIDESVLRRVIQYQCLIGNARGNIIRR